MSEIDKFLENYKISKKRKDELVSKDILIVPVKAKIENAIFIESVDILKLLIVNDIKTDYLCEKKEEINLLEYRGVETEIIVLILSVPLNLFLGILGNWIYHKYVELEDKSTKLKVKIYENKKEKINLYMERLKT